MHRTTRRLSLTEAGEDFLDRAERILQDVGEAEAAAASRSVAITGLLRVSAPATFGVLHIAPLAADFLAAHPGLTREFGFTDRYVDLLEERWDMAIRIDRLADSSLIARKLAPMRLVVCASPGYLAAHGTPSGLADLAGHDCLGHTAVSGSDPTHWAFVPDGGVKVPARSALRADNGEALVRAAVAGQGLVYGPRFIAAEALARGALVEVALDASPMDLGAAYALTLPSRRPAAKTHAWIDHLLQRLSPLATNW